MQNSTKAPVTMNDKKLIVDDLGSGLVGGRVLLWAGEMGGVWLIGSMSVDEFYREAWL